MCLLVGLRRFALYVYAQLTRVYLLLTQPFFFTFLLGNNVSPLGSFTFHSNHVDAEKKTVATARPTILPPSAVRSNANNPTDDPHLALHARTRSMARSPNDPRRRRMAHHDTAGAHARERDGGDGRLGRCALDARA